MLSPPSATAEEKIRPSIGKFLEIYNVSNDTQDLGKVAAEAAIRWLGS